MTAADLHAWHDEYLDACNRHDLDAVRSLLHPDVRRAHLPRGADAWVEDLRVLLVGFPDLQVKRILAVAEEDRLAVSVRMRGTHRGPFGGLAATGRRVNVAEFAFYRVTFGRAAEASGSSAADLLAQLRA